MPNVWFVSFSFIAKQTCLNTCHRGMLHDPTIYPAADEFRPERFGGSDTVMTKVTDIAFGFGRRACPGYHFAEGTIFAIVATVLATCDVVPVVDEYGQEIIPEVSLTSGSIVSVTFNTCLLGIWSSTLTEICSAFRKMSSVPSARDQVESRNHFWRVLDRRSRSRRFIDALPHIAQETSVNMYTSWYARCP